MSITHVVFLQNLHEFKSKKTGKHKQTTKKQRNVRSYCKRLANLDTVIYNIIR